MPAASKAQQKLFGMALACKRGAMKKCSKEVQHLADTMSEKELEKFAMTSHEGLPDHVKESIDDIYTEFAELNEAKVSNEIKQPDGKPLSNGKQFPAPNKHAMGTVTAIKTLEADEKAPIPPAIDKASEKVAITPSLFKLPMGKRKHERRIYDFNQFMKIINYKTHDGTTQNGHGQNVPTKDI